MIDWPGTQITSDTGFRLLREIDERLRLIAPWEFAGGQTIFGAA